MAKEYSFGKDLASVAMFLILGMVSLCCCSGVLFYNNDTADEFAEQTPDEPRPSEPTQKSGWIIKTCPVVRNPFNSQNSEMGYLTKPASVIVWDDGGDWLKLIEGPVKDLDTGEFLEATNIEELAIYLRRENFTSTDFMGWNLRN